MWSWTLRDLGYKQLSMSKKKIARLSVEAEVGREPIVADIEE